MIFIASLRTLQKQKLHKFEIACLANLAPSTAEEAKALLPRYLHTQGGGGATLTHGTTTQM